MKKIVHIDYIKEWEVTKDGLKLPIKDTKGVTSLYTKHYHNAIYLLAGLRPAARNLIEFLIQRMDNENIVRSDRLVRESFIKIIQEATDGEIIYSHDTVKQAFLQLLKKKLILKEGKATSRGIYLVNPEFFFRGDEAKRVSKIQLVLERESWRDK